MFLTTLRIFFLSHEDIHNITPTNYSTYPTFLRLYYSFNQKNKVNWKIMKTRATTPSFYAVSYSVAPQHAEVDHAHQCFFGAIGFCHHLAYFLMLKESHLLLTPETPLSSNPIFLLPDIFRAARRFFTLINFFILFHLIFSSLSFGLRLNFCSSQVILPYLLSILMFLAFLLL
jgi:hypothetical protein